MYGELEQKKKRKTKQKKLKTETGFLFGVVEGGGAGGRVWSVCKAEHCG